MDFRVFARLVVEYSQDAALASGEGDGEELRWMLSPHWLHSEPGGLGGETKGSIGNGHLLGS